MHPLDAFRYEGFEMVASRRFVVRRPLADVWRLLALEGDDGWASVTGAGSDVAARHTVVERFGAGEHRCTVTGSVDGRDRCTKGFRRLLAGAEVLEVQCGPGEDLLVRTSFRPRRFGRTEVVLDAGRRQVAPHAGRRQVAPDAGSRRVARASLRDGGETDVWDARLRDLEQRARARMNGRTRRAQ